MLGLIPMPYKLAAVALVVISLLGSFAVYRHSLIALGETTAITHIEDANRASEKKADDHQKTVDECYTLDGEWDRSRGVCVGASSGK